VIFSGYSGFDSTNKTDRHEITEIFLKVALNTINQPTDQIYRGEVWAHTINLTPPLFIEVSVPSQGSERSYICVRDIDFFFYDFGIGYWNRSDSVVC
jgi:hypothetical protein